MEGKVQIENGLLLFECPHCSQLVQVLLQQINCKIFRHAVYKQNMVQVNPHMREEDCKKLGDTVYGCTKPFQLVVMGDSFVVEKCEYI